MCRGPEADAKGCVTETNGRSTKYTSEQLRQRPDLCAVDGVVYDLASFAPKHPGGAHIAAAGAYDASALFHSMHAGMSPETSSLFQEHRVGIHVKSASDEPAIPTYRYDSPFAKDLLQSVRKALGARSWYAPTQFWVRTAIILTATVIAEWHWASQGSYVWGGILGVCHALIGLAVQHDASHGALSKQGWVNSLFAYGADVIGSNRWIWFQQHILWHHPYTNHVALDGDATSAEPLLLFHDYGSLLEEPRRWAARKFQHLYMHLVLALYGPSMTLNVGYLTKLQHSDLNAESLFAKGGFFSNQKPIAWLWRAFYVSRCIIAPWWFGGVPLAVSLWYVAGINGTILTLLFVVSHNFEDSDRTPEQKPGEEEVDWYKMQIETSSTYGGYKAMVLTGGLNLQIEHHCFPRLSSWHYPLIAPAVKECCKRHGVRYVGYPNLLSNLRSTWAYMQKVGIRAVLAEAQKEF